jgi:hypothetical protein
MDAIRAHVREARRMRTQWTDRELLLTDDAEWLLAELERVTAALRDAGVVIERMANGATRAECSPEFERVHDALFGGARVAKQAEYERLAKEIGEAEAYRHVFYPAGAARAAQEDSEKIWGPERMRHDPERKR